MSCFANDIERFWKKIHEERNVKIANCLRGGFINYLKKYEKRIANREP